MPQANQKFRIEYEWWDADFEITDKAKAARACKESLDFYGDPITREDESDDGTITAFLKFWAPTLIRLSMSMSTSQIIEESQQMEGGLTLDGKAGIRLTNCTEWHFEPDDFQVRNIL